MNYQELSQIVNKKSHTIAMFFSRKGLSIKNPMDIKKYLDYLAKGKQWRTSDYRAPHLAKYRFSKTARSKECPAKIIKQFPRYIFWDRNPRSITKPDFIKRVVQYGTIRDVQKMLRVMPKQEIKAVYRDRHALLAGFNQPLINTRQPEKSNHSEFIS